MRGAPPGRAGSAHAAVELPPVDLPPVELQSAAEGRTLESRLGSFDPRPPPSPYAPCIGESLSFEFFNAELAWSNLGGLGPDTTKPNGIRYVNVGSTFVDAIGTVRFDLYVSTTTSYTPYDAQLNGLNGRFAQINVKANTEVGLRVEVCSAPERPSHPRTPLSSPRPTLIPAPRSHPRAHSHPRACLLRLRPAPTQVKPSCCNLDNCKACENVLLGAAERAACYAQGCCCFGITCTTAECCSGAARETKKANYGCAAMNLPISFPSNQLYGMSVYDFDSGVAGEYVEQLTVRDYEYFVAPLRPASGKPVRSTIAVDPTRTVFTSTALGTPFDNPSDPTALTDKQAGNAIQFFFRGGKGAVDATFRVTYAGVDFRGRRLQQGLAPLGGRNLLFAGDSALCAPPPPLPPAAPPPPPSPPPPSPPAPSPPQPAAPPPMPECEQTRGRVNSRQFVRKRQDSNQRVPPLCTPPKPSVPHAAHRWVRAGTDLHARTGTHPPSAPSTPARAPATSGATALVPRAQHGALQMLRLLRIQSQQRQHQPLLQRGR